MRYVVCGMVACCLVVLWACLADAPTRPSETPSPDLHESGTSASGTETSTPTTVEPGDSGNGVSDSEGQLSGELTDINPGRATARNDRNSDEVVSLCSYKFVTPGGSLQELYKQDRKNVPSGAVRNFQVRVPECGGYQLDLIRGECKPGGDHPLYTSTLAARLVEPRNRPSCEPPPPPPPPCVKPPRPEGYRCEWLAGECRWQCYTCEDVNPPSHNNLQVNVTDSRIDASYRAHNAGTWTLTLYAGFPNNPTRWRKSHDTDVNRCGQSQTVRVGYNHRNHSGCLWTLVASGPTIDFSRVVLNRCNVN